SPGEKCARSSRTSTFTSSGEVRSAAIFRENAAFSTACSSSRGAALAAVALNASIKMNKRRHMCYVQNEKAPNGSGPLPFLVPVVDHGLAARTITMILLDDGRAVGRFALLDHGALPIPII